MGPVTYSLCHKPVLALVMYLAGACVFPPLFDREPFPLQQANARIVKEFEAPVGTAYFLELNFHYSSAPGFRSDDIVGTQPHHDCELDYADIPQSRRARMGPPIPVHVVIREKQTGEVRIDRVFNSQCMVSWTTLTVTRAAARIDLPKGAYVIDMRNMASQAGLDQVKTTVSLVPGRLK